VVPPSDISRTRPLVRLILNQIARRLTEKLKVSTGALTPARQLLLMLDEFPALGRLEFFETALTFLAGYGVRAFLVAQSLNQIEKAYGPNNAILDNCHVRVAFAPNDERTAKRLSEALGTMTEQRAQRNLAGHRLSPWLSHLAVSSQETPRPLMTAGEVMQLPAGEQLVLVSGTPPVRARKLTYFTDRNFTERCLPPPRLMRADHMPATRGTDDWSGHTRATDARLEQPWSDLVSSAGRTPEPVPAHERAPELPGVPNGDLDLLRDDEGAPSIQPDDVASVDRDVVDDDLTPAL
jgi:type IV secretion system protein VirD4